MVLHSVNFEALITTTGLGLIVIELIKVAIQPFVPVPLTVNCETLIDAANGALSAAKELLLITTGPGPYEKVNKLVPEAVAVKLA